MTALTARRASRTKIASILELPSTAQTVYEGGVACWDTSTGLVAKGAASTTLIPIGIYKGNQLDANGATVIASGGTALVELNNEITFRWMVNHGSDTVVAASLGGLVYLYDDQTVGNTSNGGTLSVAGRAWRLDTIKGVLVSTDFTQPTTSAATLTSNLAAITHGNGAALIGIEDAGNFTAKATVENALAEIYQTLETAQGIIAVPIQCALLGTTGAPLAVFADNAASAPGLQINDAASYGVAWNDAATQVAVANVVPLPLDLDVTKAIVVRALVSKSGATVGDAVKLTITAKFLKPASLDDFDSDHGGDTNALTGNATTKTVTKLSLTIAANALSAVPAALVLTYKPKNGTLGTDDCYCHAMWLEYTKMVLTS